MKNIDWGWQGKARKLRMRGEYLFENLPIPADIVFRVSDKDGNSKVISAHKLVLGIGSQVFFAMFYGPNAKKNEDAIPIPNYSAEVFKIVLGFLYSDRIPDNKMTIDQLMDVLMCADQYGIVELSTGCGGILTDALRRTDDFGVPVSDTKMLYVLKKARETENLEVIQAASEALSRKVKKFLYSAKVPSYELLYEFVKGTETQLEPKDEIKIYHAACRWAKAQREDEVSQGLPKRTLRKIMGPLFQPIRFPLMSSAEIAEGPVKDGMFTLKEMTALYRQQFSPEPSKPKLFPDAVRKTDYPSQKGLLEFVITAKRDSEGLYGPITIVIYPFAEGVSQVTTKFLRLCAENYSFDLECDGALLVDIHTEKERFPRSDLSTAMKVELVKLDVPEAEKKIYLHDSAGTVALRWVETTACELGGYLCVDISTGKGLDRYHSVTYDGTVFGRIRNLRAAKAQFEVPRLFCEDQLEVEYETILRSSVAPVF